MSPSSKWCTIFGRLKVLSIFMKGILRALQPSLLIFAAVETEAAAPRFKTQSLRVPMGFILLGLDFKNGLVFFPLSNQCFSKLLERQLPALLSWHWHTNKQAFIFLIGSFQTMFYIGSLVHIQQQTGSLSLEGSKIFYIYLFVCVFILGRGDGLYINRRILGSRIPYVKPLYIGYLKYSQYLI